ncbi:beta-ketoacyl-[acyl-carrier-protein] synthase family protein [Streptosporangiaceae bacterium NEAU-GS5]|nr:beta-ketoacyl-[acyl-carrier-protein] synthase family protein [Streptosporangiaceae bacterium NEAU-GS5]
MRCDAAITGIGLVTPAGIGTAATWRGICAGAGTAAAFDAALPGLAARVPDFDGDAILGRRKAWRLDRCTQLALVAAREAVEDSGLDPGGWDGARVGVVIGSGIGGASTWETQYRTLLDSGPSRVSALLIPMLAVNMTAGQLAIEYGARGPNLVTATACASGATAIGIARELLRSGRCDVVVTGGTEACVIPSIVAGFAQMSALTARHDDPAGASRPFDLARDGFVPAEGAAVLILERLADARARGAHVYAAVSGYGASADAHHPTHPHPAGLGGELALRDALSDAGLEPGAIDHVNAHATATPLGDVAEARMIRRTLGDEVSVTSVKGVTGHALGAAGAIEAAVTALSIERAYVPPTANLSSQDPEIELDVVAKEGRPARIGAAVSNSFGFGGQNAVLVLTEAT